MFDSVSIAWANQYQKPMMLLGNSGGQCPPYIREWRGPPTRITANQYTVRRSWLQSIARTVNVF